MNGDADDGRSRTAADREAEEWYARLQRDGSAAMRARFEVWLDRSPENRPAYERLTSVLEMGDMLRDTETGNARQLGKAPIWQRQSVRHASVAAALALVVIGGSALVNLNSAPQPVTIAAKDDVFETAVGEKRTVALKDGSRVHLDTGSTLGVAYTGKLRRLDLRRGGARFEVAHGDLRPFVVGTAGGIIIARGTVFDISITDRQTRVALIQGRIEVRAANNASNAPVSRRFLSPGQEVVLMAGSNIVPSPGPVAQKDEPPKADMLSFDATPLDEAIDALNRRNPRKIGLADPAIAKLRVTGAFRIDDPAGFAAAAAAMFELLVREHADGSLTIGQPK